MRAMNSSSSEATGVRSITREGIGGQTIPPRYGCLVEAELQRVGRSIQAAFPEKTRNPFRALDQQAMDLATRDMDLRAALFRFVDVTPACRSLDDLARHLVANLEEVDAPPPPIAAAMRMSGTKAGRAALGAAAAAG